MVERRSVRFTSDGKLEEFDKIDILKLRRGNALDDVQLDNLTVAKAIDFQNQEQHSGLREITMNQSTDVGSAEVIQSIQSKPDQSKLNSDIGWTSLLLTFIVLFLALYSIKALVKKLIKLRRSLQKSDSLGNTNRSGLLADMDEEWRLQKVDVNNTELKAQNQNSQVLQNQSWSTYFSSGQNNLSNRKRGESRSSQKQMNNDDDEYKRS